MVVFQPVDSMALDSFCVALCSNPEVAIDGSSSPTISFCPQLENGHSVLKTPFHRDLNFFGGNRE